MKHAVGAHGATVSYAGRSFINGHGSHLLSMFTPSYSAFWALCAKRRAVQTARHRLSKKSACGGLFRQVCAVSLSPLRGSRAGNAVRKPCCARLPNPPRMSLDSNTARRAAALRTSQKAFSTVWGDRFAAVSFFMRVIVTFLAAQTRRRGKKTQIRSVAYA